MGGQCIPGEAIQLQGRGAAGQSGCPAEAQAQGLLGLQAADQAVTGRKPVQVGDQQLAGQQAAFIDQTFIWFTGWALITAYGEGSRSLHRSLPRKLLCDPRGTHYSLPGALPADISAVSRDMHPMIKGSCRALGDGETLKFWRWADGKM